MAFYKVWCRWQSTTDSPSSNKQGVFFHFYCRGNSPSSGERLLLCCLVLTRSWICIRDCWFDFTDFYLPSPSMKRSRSIHLGRAASYPQISLFILSHLAYTTPITSHACMIRVMSLYKHCPWSQQRRCNQSLLFRSGPCIYLLLTDIFMAPMPDAHAALFSHPRRSFGWGS